MHSSRPVDLNEASQGKRDNRACDEPTGKESNSNRHDFAPIRTAWKCFPKVSLRDADKAAMTIELPDPKDPKRDLQLSATALSQSIDAIRVAQGKTSISKLKQGTAEFEEAEEDMLRMTLIALGEDPDDDSDDFLDKL